MYTFRRIRPWLTIIIVVANVTLAATGMLTVGTAVTVAVVLEVATWAVLLTAVPAAVGRFRTSRGVGMDRWQATECALSEIVPSRVARWMMYDPRVWACFASLARRRGPRDGEFAYHAERKIITLTFLVVFAFDTVVTHVVLALIFGNTWWVWLVTASDVYFTLWIAGLYAGYVTLPHRVDDAGVLIRTGYIDEIRIPHAAVAGVEARMHEDGGKRLQLGADGTATLSCGPANVTIHLVPSVAIAHRGRLTDLGVSAVHCTVDDVAGFVRAVRAESGLEEGEFVVRLGEGGTKA